MKTYLLSYHWAIPVKVFEALEKAGIDEWLQVWPGMILFKGNESERYYATKINQQEKACLFFVTEYDPEHAFGWMPSSVWEWVKPAASAIPEAGLHPTAEHQPQAHVSL